MILLLLLWFGWMVCGQFACGFVAADTHPGTMPPSEVFALSCLGPIGLLAVLLAGQCAYGLKFD